MGRLQDRVAIITGAGDGIGRGIARAFARDGARVLVAELHGEAGVAVADELTTEFGAQASAVTTDVADESAVRAMVAVAVERWGTVDILVNNVWAGAAWAGSSTRRTNRWPTVFWSVSMGRSGPCRLPCRSCVPRAAATSSTSARSTA